MAQSFVMLRIWRIYNFLGWLGSIFGDLHTRFRRRVNTFEHMLLFGLFSRTFLSTVRSWVKFLPKSMVWGLQTFAQFARTMCVIKKPNDKNDDLYSLSKKDFVKNLRVFGVKMWTKISILAKN